MDKIPEMAPPGCTCGYPRFENGRVRFHTFECQLRTGMNTGQAIAWVLREIDFATRKFGEYRSVHEGYAIIREELEHELWEHVCKNTGTTDAAFEEAIQVAATALKYVINLSEGRPVHAGRPVPLKD